MSVYHLIAKPAIAAGLAAGLPVGDRLAAVAIAAGYVLGEGGIQVYADGSVVIDTDRDPSADWEAFDPVTMLTPAEIAANQVRAEIDAALTQLDSDAQNLETLTNITLRNTQLGFARTNRSLAKLIRYLDQQGVI